MTASNWDGKERRSRSDFEREVCDFMSRIDQRNMDKDIQSAAMYETVIDNVARINKLENWRNFLTGAWIAACGIFTFWATHSDKVKIK